MNTRKTFARGGDFPRILGAVGLLMLSGCFSVKLDGKFRHAPREGEAGPRVEAISIDGFVPEIIDGEDGASIGVYAAGKFLVDDRPVKEFTYDKYMSIGLLPSFTGRHKHVSYDSALIHTWGAAWPNLFTLGAPTVCGLLVNPFVEAEWANELSEVALVGAWRYHGDSGEVVREGVEEMKPAEKVLLKDYTLSINGEKFYAFRWDGVVAIDKRWVGHEVNIRIVSKPDRPNGIKAAIPDSVVGTELWLTIPSSVKPAGDNMKDKRQ